MREEGLFCSRRCTLIDAKERRPMDTESDGNNLDLNPDHAHRIAAISSIQPDDSQPLTQFSPEQRAAYEWAIKWLHDFNLGRMPKPGFPDEVLGRLSGFHEAQMSVYLRQKESAAPPVDPEAEWDQRILQGMNRMDHDPKFRASIEQRLS